MNITRQAAELKDQLNFFRNKKKEIGFVPTMGALHEGHLSLIGASKAKTDVTVCSIFVNPAQFNDPRDYEKYPNTIEKDIEFLRKAETDLVFVPSVNEIYSKGIANLEQYDLGYLETILEGRYRPGHFQGVCQVMERLLQMVQPHQLFMGQKDYQQCMVIQKLLNIMQFEGETSLQVCQTVREADGLAMSSRNLRLNPQERKKAVTINKALQFAKDEIEPGDLTRLEIEAASMLTANGFKVDYFEIAKAENLELVNEWDGKTKLVALTAAFLNQIRLIDNMLLN
ncbi:MAG TPA: pantoate--beta-alanine ligase [Chitinophagaceae bacterium]|nr:pantoate--beta-alanine ligase [Chitinophagaceae bacterium]